MTLHILLGMGEREDNIFIAQDKGVKKIEVV